MDAEIKGSYFMIRIQNIYYMLAYVYKGLDSKHFAKLSTESFENIEDFYAELMLLALSKQVRQGLVKDYILEEEELSSPRGKLLLTESLRERSLRKKKLYCQHDEFSCNHLWNRILKTSLETLCKAKIQKTKKAKLRQLLDYFQEVESLSLRRFSWKEVDCRKNRSYQLLLGIARLILESALQTEKKGRHSMQVFEEENLPALYERFVLAFYKKEFPEIKVHAPHVKWALDDGMDAFLPTMRTDICLEAGRKILIIDTKYYKSILGGRFQSQKFSSNNLYQIFSYVKNWQALAPEKEISGLLLYAATGEQLEEQSYQMSGNQISVQSLNLNTDFQEIRRKLRSIVEGM